MSSWNRQIRTSSSSVRGGPGIASSVLRLNSANLSRLSVEDFIGSMPEMISDESGKVGDMDIRGGAILHQVFCPYDLH